ncbi:Heterocyst differentiation ATP-binding protein HepA [Paenibacillus konkukensis]|uniref:Heterocyst differentiation ATP-binding protein HepA n=1 Tax=Paenibacillus konkukensis TaxID=2020716 RepID=A0ABY4RUM1_9BACL|nr:ABC transporter ATP-binding protein [Paenibacillus konkukensis]UQZ85685.1 Heterocyst differentiation ATP-binding protein HepA [Paenibacillus konkukensis]
MKQVLYFARKMHAYAGNILFVNLLGMTLVGFLDGIGMFLLIPLLSLIGILQINAGSIPLAGGLDLLKELPGPLSLLIVLAIYAALVIGQALIQRNLSLRDIRIHTGFINHVRMETYRSLLQADWDFFIKRRKSDFIHAMTDELGRVTNGTYVFLQFAASLVFTLIQIAIAFWLSAKLTLFVIGCGLLLAFFSRVLIRRSRTLGGQTSELARSYIAGITDHFNGIKDIKSNMLEESRNRWLAEWCERIGEERYGHAKLRSDSQLYYKAASALIIAAFVYLSSYLFHTQGGQLLLIMMIFSRLWPRFTGIQSNLEQIASALPAFASLLQLQEQCRASREIRDGELAPEDVAPLAVERGLECRGVSFRYNRQEPVRALERIDLYIPAMRMTAVIGRSGAGKSTLIDMLMGLLRPEEGQVLVDGVPLGGRLLQRLRKAVGYVPQDPLLFGGSIRENLLLIDPEASERQLWEALEFAAADEFVRRLPQGLDTLIGDRGVRLSGGERQRLVLARAILRRPSILVLDEATSALDAENEARIQEALERLKGKMTIVVIAHRLSTIRNADQVVVLDQGRIVQQGGFTQLSKERGKLFAHLLRNQMMPDAENNDLEQLPV